MMFWIHRHTFLATTHAHPPVTWFLDFTKIILLLLPVFLAQTRSSYRCSDTNSTGIVLLTSLTTSNKRGLCENMMWYPAQAVFCTYWTKQVLNRHFSSSVLRFSEDALNQKSSGLTSLCRTHSWYGLCAYIFFTCSLISCHFLKLLKCSVSTPVNIRRNSLHQTLSSTKAEKKFFPLILAYHRWYKKIYRLVMTEYL